MDPRDRAFLIWGAGGHGKVVADLIRSAGGSVVGFVDRSEEKLDQVVDAAGACVVLTEDQLLESARVGSPLPGDAALVPAIGDNRTRLNRLRHVASLLSAALVHPTAVVSTSARLGRGTVVFPTAVVNPDARIGRGVIINSGAVVEHDCRVGDGAHLSPNATLGGGARVGVGTWIGAGATVIQGVSVGDHTIVGAGATVIRDLEGHVTAVGTPVRIVKRHETGAND